MNTVFENLKLVFNELERRVESIVGIYFYVIGNHLQISLRMDIICAGFPKTGSKSCSAALRTLGYNVADYPETLEFLGETWWKFMNGEIDANSVIGQYKVRVSRDGCLILNFISRNLDSMLIKTFPAIFCGRNSIW